MMTIILIIIGILSFMILVITHELGHFFAAKKSGVKVNEFGIGLPPRICKVWTDKSGTEYTINAIPLGGFCVLEGDDPNRPEATFAKDSFVTAKLWKKLLIMIGGVTVNLLTAFFIFVGLFWHGVEPLGISSLPSSESYLIPSKTFLENEGFLATTPLSGVLITKVEENSLFQPGDILLTFNDHEVTMENLKTFLAESTHQTSLLGITRLSGDVEISETLSFVCEDECTLGVYYTENADYQISPVKFGFGRAILASLHEIKAQRGSTLEAMKILGKSLISFDKHQVEEAFSSLSGPVGAVKMGELFYRSGGISAYLAFVGIIALALAIFNLLPIPALDGGTALCLILQSIFHISHEKYLKYIGYLNTFFFGFLMLLGVIIIVKDLVTFRGLSLPFLG